MGTGRWTSCGGTVWRHAVSGQNAIWFMDGINRVRGTFMTPSTLPDTNWKIVGPR